MQVKIEKLDNFGRGIAFINKKICFIDNALPDEIVDIEILKEKKKYLEAKVIKYITTSNKRIDVDCPYYDRCGGCQLRHLSYEEENIYKENKVKELLQHIGNINPRINKIVYGNEYNYRNKVTLHNKDNKIGKNNLKSNEIIEIKECKILDERINKELDKINSNNDEIIIKTINDSKNISINNETIITNIGNKNYYLSKDSFFQVNKYLTKELYDLVKKAIDKKYNNCLDLYCGTGTIGIYISDLVSNIIGIDYNESNINDAIRNKEINNVDNIEFICNKVENCIDKFNNIDLVIVDPPRSGLDKKTIEYLKIINSKKIIYVSCDPATLSRDLKELNTNYNIVEVTPVNMFPRTYHVETVSVLNRKSVEK